ncbi:asparagine synthase (glutamine-hydrolyzing) [Bradyrhizobium japonicum]|uniref:asparagine synthase (glutamine-hydrolyzing) n=1 Tax=Bradyrhizobium elkanii TaxID=29448 RepID=UPI000370AA0D|nr:asparagine synthase (glutamine-hydrolyzing) [Bradyrhizobium elkanii]MCP1732619.1 asparagine synthase (glutamine-hydrolyzing) [Bradyrhizobium elkanii]MCS3567957.1 asparagine synthase (glutamine-hydrolyzing) [Bradyrhizobium elkanii]MCS3590560.1 asparagine synthase (glutamine-hydrolyzing) [Bradyrhizobium elkanii]MCS3620003.1 asparagine synthase (glutamine-hydrolyzing) [Bradyrhizobium elkanii]MCW2111743.1 asparagine synthase (glutamine-hydrolyzing) [Bradyrhizobium elkanii]
MCGIAGIVNLRDAPVEPADISRLTNLIAHRGPFGEGTWFNAKRNVAFGHRRLAIIDPGEGGYQPMVSGDSRHVIVYNGEIYNFLELRRELEAKGAVFRSQSDTEVILAAWQAWGEDMLLRFNGMWALAIYDTATDDLFLARDRFGIKPMLYALSSERFVFASEQRALARSGLVETSLDIDVARRLLLDPFGIEGSERTLFAQLRRLQGGHCMWLRKGRVQVRRWWRTVDHLPAIPDTEVERVERFRELFQDSVALRMRSDVPIGTCLSGGFDSSAVICAMATHEKAGMGPRGSTAWRHAFVATFPGASNDERPMAEEAAAWADVAPSFLEIGRSDALTDLDRILDDNDDVYIGLPSAPWLIYRELRRQNVTVSLDGHGADELMGAYLQEGQLAAFRIRNAAAALTSRSQLAQRGIDFLRAQMIRREGHYFLRGGVAAAPAPLPLVAEDDELPDTWGALNRRLYRMFHSTTLPTILRNFDRLSMAHGIEVRMPFMDWRLVTYTMALPETSKSADGLTKVVARQAMANLMPESIRTARRKVGFNSPMPEWLNGPLAGWTAELLDRNVPAFAQFVDEAPLRRAVGRLTASQSWDWKSVGRIWPYLNMKWMLARS